MSAPITEAAYIVVCVGEDAILEGPGPTPKSLLLAVAGNPGFDLVVARPVVIEFEGKQHPNRLPSSISSASQLGPKIPATTRTSWPTATKPRRTACRSSRAPPS